MTSGVVIFSPLPPEKSGIATYCDALTRALSVHTTCYIVVDDNSPATTASDRPYQVMRYSEWSKSTDLHELPHVFHLANNTDVRHALAGLRRKPGTVILHDLSLHYLVETLTLPYGKERYVAFTERCEGPSGGTLARQFADLRLGGDFFRNEVTLSSPILQQAERIIVHSKYAAMKVALFEQQPNVAVIPHFATPLAANADAALYRLQKQQLAYSEKDVVLGMFGFGFHSKRIDLVLEAVRRARDAGAERLKVLYVGEPAKDQYDLEAAIADLGLASAVRVTGFVPDEVFYSCMMACDAVINLRYPSAGEASGPLSNALAMGKICVVSDTAAYTEIQGPNVIHIKHEKDVVEQLCGAFQKLSAMSSSELMNITVKAKQTFSTELDINALVLQHLKMYGAVSRSN